MNAYLIIQTVALFALTLGSLRAEPPSPTPSTPISADRIKADVKVLSSDEFLGRGPGEAGEQKTVAYLSDAFAKMGLEPAGENGTWTQDVPLVRLDRLPGATMSLNVAGKSTPLALGRNASLALRVPGATTVNEAPLVFAGFGVVNPALHFDAYAGIDLTGKIAVILANDPDFEAGKDLGFEGRRMSLAGRTGLKLEAAGKAGAIGAIIIHEEAATSYPFTQMGSGDALPAMAIAPLPASTLKFSGYIAVEVANDLLKKTGLALPELKVRARDAGFRAFLLKDATLNVSGELKVTPFTSHNVLAQLKGATRPNEFILYGAHWDANGQNGPDASGDGIRNGAIDNATGTSEVLEIARAFKAGKPSERTVIFAAWTAEEKGLLGSEYYAAHPLHPLSTLAAVINLDPHVVLPAARDLELIGAGRTSLEDDFARAAKAQGLRVSPEPNPEAGWYFRSDHFSFAKRGVPALAFRAGRDLVDGSTAAGQKIVSAFNTNCYHQPCDQFDPHWTFAGTVQEATVAYSLGRDLADSTAWPNWKDGNEYQPLRTQTEGERRR